MCPACAENGEINFFDAAVLVATGIDANGTRVILGVSIALSAAEVHWRDFLSSLQDRGLHGTTFIVSDDWESSKNYLNTNPSSQQQAA